MQTQSRSGWTCRIVGSLVLFMIIFNVNWGKKGETSAQSQEPVTSVSAVPAQVTASIATQRLTQAKTEGKYVYLMFYESDNSDCQTMEKNIDKFARKNKKNTEIIKVDRKDPNNSDIVAAFRTQTAPIPLILLINPGSAILAAFTQVVSIDELSQAFPSPKKEETLKYMQEGKGVILCFSSKKMNSCKDIQTCCSMAESQLAGKAEYISIDLSDSKETNFIKELKVDPKTTVPVTFVINPQGQVTGKYDGEVQVANLVEAATKVVKSGCCPPGSGKTCGPKQPQKK